jgi:hypothetical protein
MDEEDIVALARMLVKRLSDSSDPHSNDWQEVVNQAIRGVRKFLAKRPDPPTAVPWQWLLVARIRTLPEHMQEPLKRYYVFQEAEESICLSIKTPPKSFAGFCGKPPTIFSCGGHAYLNQSCPIQDDPETELRLKSRISMLGSRSWSAQRR